MRFQDRYEAGRVLAQALQYYRGQDAVVYALPRGGVVLGKVVADALEVPLDVVIPRKIGHPQNPEYAIAAVTESGDLVVNTTEVDHVDSVWFAEEKTRQQVEAQRRRIRYVPAGQHVSATGKTAIIVDDGIATGLTMKAAILELRKQRPAAIVVAVPVAPSDVIAILRPLVDDVITLEAPELFYGGVGNYYDEFAQVTDEEVIRLMQ